MTAAIFPAYGLARFVVSRPWAVGAATVAVAAPPLAYAPIPVGGAAGLSPLHGRALAIRRLVRPTRGASIGSPRLSASSLRSSAAAHRSLSHFRRGLVRPALADQAVPPLGGKFDDQRLGRAAIAHHRRRGSLRCSDRASLDAWYITTDFERPHQFVDHGVVDCRDRDQPQRAPIIATIAAFLSPAFARQPKPLVRRRPGPLRWISSRHRPPGGREELLLHDVRHHDRRRNIIYLAPHHAHRNDCMLDRDAHASRSRRRPGRRARPGRRHRFPAQQSPSSRPRASRSGPLANHNFSCNSGR